MGFWKKLGKVALEIGREGVRQAAEGIGDFADKSERSKEYREEYEDKPDDELITIARESYGKEEGFMKPRALAAYQILRDRHGRERTGEMLRGESGQ